MFRVFIASIFILLFFSMLGNAQTSQDSLSIKNNALNYIEGWYAGDEERMEQAIHPKLAKRLVAKNPENGYNFLVITSALELFQQTRNGGGSTTPESERNTEVTILDIYGNAASVKVDAGGWIDYMHMAKWNEEWKIINVLWEINPHQK